MNDIEIEEKIDILNKLVDDSNVKPIMEEHTYLIIPSNLEEKPNYNTSVLHSMYSKLIRECGRFTESYNADLIIGTNTLNRKLEKMAVIATSDANPEKEIKPSYHWFGIRRQGVDHDAYIVNQIDQKNNDAGYLDYYYSRIYCIKLQPEDNGRNMKITMYNMKQKVISATFREKFKN